MKNKLQNFKEKVQAMRNKKGFTLIELIVVIAILGILVLLAAPKFLGYTQDANVATLQADAKVLENTALVYHVDQEVDGNPGAWPVDESKVFSLDVDGDPATTDDNYTGYALDKAKFGDSVKTLKGDFTDYALTDKGEAFFVGDVTAGTDAAPGVVTKGVKDGDGNEYFGTGIVKEAN